MTNPEKDSGPVSSGNPGDHCSLKWRGHSQDSGRCPDGDSLWSGGATVPDCVPRADFQARLLALLLKPAEEREPFVFLKPHTRALKALGLHTRISGNKVPPP